VSDERPFRTWPLAGHGLLCAFGDRIDLDLSQRIAWLAAALVEERHAGVVDVVPSYTTLLVALEPGVADVPGILAAIDRQWKAVTGKPVPIRPAREVIVPVSYGSRDGPDLHEVARHTGLSVDEVILRHTGMTYRVGTIGFSPGFAYLIGLPPELATPRRATPRVRVPVGSVGIGGAQTGVYSCPTPGGWSLIGRTSLSLFDPEQDPPSLLRVGDAVRFEVVSRLERSVASLQPESSRQPRQAALEVLEPGLLTTVQDLGRPGYGGIGVAPGGAADRGALVRGNRLLGNPDGAAALECTINGPRLRVLRPGRIVLSGANLGARLNGLFLPVEAVRVVKPGDELEFAGRRLAGARAYLCLAGGIDVPVRLGSRATDLVGGFGGHQGRPLLRGDHLAVGRNAGVGTALDPEPPSPGPVRIVRGPQADRFPEETWKLLLEREFTISPQSNRQGLRLEGPALVPVGGADIISQGVITGAIQVTGEGQPIVMLPARATTGGYPQIATVVAADLDRLGQLAPGDRVRFAEVTVPWPAGW
jgi:KipI family sensor histidine kinase inhibitor